MPSAAAAAAAATAVAKEVDFLEAEPTRLPYDEDLYDAVFVSAFRGITMELDKHSLATVAPAVLFLLCLPLFAAQFALGIFLCLDMELDTKIRGGHADDEMEVTIQLLLVIIVQLSFFHQIMDTLRKLLFLLNPVTWIYVDHLKSQDWISWGSHVAATAVFATAAIFAKLVVLNWVSTLSSSIILACTDVKDAIFNCLVIAFIVDLSQDMWRFVCDSFSMQFQVPEGGLRVRRAKHVPCPVLPGGQLHWMARSRAEKIFATLTLFVLYCRHFVIVMWALDTNVLPVARDVCSQWHWLHHRANHTVGMLYGTVLRWICDQLLGVMRNPLPDFDRKADPEQGGLCTEEYFRITWSHSLPILRRHPRESATFLVALFCLLVLPPILRKFGIMGILLKRQVSLPQVIRSFTYLDVVQPAAASQGGSAAGSLVQSREGLDRCRTASPSADPL